MGAKAEIGAISQENIEGFRKRFEQYRSKVEDNLVLAEELTMIINEMKAAGILSKSDFQAMWAAKAFLNRILDKVAPESKLFIPLRNYEDVSGFLDRYQAKFFAGAKVQTAPPEREGDRASLALLDQINALSA